MSKKIAVVLSGCGYLDGAEINEAVLTYLHLDKAQAQVSSFAPNQPQLHVVDHINGEPTSESRNLLTEAARITRGAIQPLEALEPEAFDALILPGGFGAAKNLSDFAMEGSKMNVLPLLLEKAQAFAKASKPIGLICIAPAMAAAIYQKPVVCTIGTDAETAAVIESLGATHKNCAVDDIIVDTEHKLVTTPAYMLAQRISEADRGISRLVQALLEMA